MNAKAASRFRILNAAIFFALSFNLIYFLHELALVVAGAWLGNDPILLHNNMHYLNLTQPAQNLAFAAGPVAVLLAGLLGMAVYFMTRPSHRLLKLFLFWLSYNGLWLFLGQLPEIAFANHGDLARGLSIFNLSQPLRNAGALLGMAGLIGLGVFAAKPLLATAISADELSTAGKRRKLILQGGILPWLLGAMLVIPFRVPPLERAILPFYGGIPLLLTLLAAGRAKNVAVSAPAGHAKISWAGVAALLGVFLFFLGILAAGIPFYNLFYQPTSNTAAPVYCFVNGKWFDGNTFVSKTFYSIDRILRREYAGPVDSTIDLQNQFVLPPFAEAHNHHFSEGQDYRAQINTYLTQGIFYAKNPNNTAKWTAPIRPHLNLPASIDAVFANGGLTASGGHPIQLYEQLARQNNIFGWTTTKMRGQAYFVVDDENDLQAQWPRILAGRPDFIKTYLESSEDCARRKNDPQFFGQKGLDPLLLPKIVERAHREHLRVTTHVNTAVDFHHAVMAGVDEIAHLPLEKISAADAMLAAQHGTVVVTTTLSHRPTAHVENLDEIHRYNLRRLDSCGVKLAIGTDNNDLTALDEAENIHRLRVFDNLHLLKIWVENTPLTIFPERRIGRLAEGYEASFIALEGNPLEDFSNVNRIGFRFKQGQIIPLSASQRSIADALRPFVFMAGPDSAVAQYRRLKTTQPDLYNFAESELNTLGYQLLNHGKALAALAVFRLNAEAYPHSANVYDSLADAALAAGDSTLAIQCYEKVLALLPTSPHYPAEFKQRLAQNARAGLQRLQTK